LTADSQCIEKNLKARLALQFLQGILVLKSLLPVISRGGTSARILLFRWFRAVKEKSGIADNLASELAVNGLSILNFRYPAS